MRLRKCTSRSSFVWQKQTKTVQDFFDTFLKTEDVGRLRTIRWCKRTLNLRVVPLHSIMIRMAFLVHRVKEEKRTENILSATQSRPFCQELHQWKESERNNRRRTIRKHTHKKTPTNQVMTSSNLNDNDVRVTGVDQFSVETVRSTLTLQNLR